MAAGRWHAGGKGVHKMNSVADLEASMDRLIELGEGISSLTMCQKVSITLHFYVQSIEAEGRLHERYRTGAI